MANIATQDIKNLQLLAGGSYPIVGLRISKAINSLPVCTVTISCGGTLNTNGTITEPSFPSLDTQAKVVATVGGATTTLFSGYIATEVTDTSSTHETIKSYKTFRLGSATEYLDCIPPASVAYLDNTYNGNALLQQGTLIASNASKRALNALNTKKAMAKQANVTSLILTAAQQANDNYETIGKLTISKYITGDNIKLNIPVEATYDGIAGLLTSYVTQGLNYFQIIYHACMELGLALVPIMHNGVDMLCIKNRPAWCSDNMQTLSIAEYSGIHSNYSSVANKRVDGVVVPLLDDFKSIQSSTGFVMYGEGFGAGGKPVIRTSDTLKKEARFRLKCKLVPVPGWLKGLAKNGSFRTVAEAKAITEFANHAHQQSTVSAAITYKKYLRLVNNIGDMIKLEVIKEGVIKDSGSSLSTEYMYGRLSAVDLSININNSKVSVACSCMLTHVVTPAIFNKYKISKSQMLFT